jgi:hypothetical protein
LNGSAVQICAHFCFSERHRPSGRKVLFVGENCPFDQ